VTAAALALLPLADAWGMHDNDIGTGWWIVMMLGMVVFWGLVIFGIVWLVRESSGVHRHHGAVDDPRMILDRRLAEGEISVREYQARRKTLGG
jgi:putative membrane protein